MAAAAKPSSISLFSGTVTRTWSIPPDTAGAASVELNHNTLTGAHELSIDGSEVPGTRSSSLSSEVKLVFHCRGGRGEVLIQRVRTTVTYTCSWKGEIVVSDHDRLATSVEEAAFRVLIPEADIGVSNEGKHCTL
jgi:hypothetical protein